MANDKKVYAFPCKEVITVKDPLPGCGGNILEYHSGMELRDYFAGKAMRVFLEAAILKNEKLILTTTICKDSYTMANAMMKEKENT